MKVAIFGLGNVGLVAALCMADLGHEVIGVEVSEEKVNQLNDGSLYFYEEGLTEIFSKGLNISYVQDISSLEGIDVVIICVGTPSKKNGEVYLEQVENTIIGVCNLLKKEDRKIDVVLRSTIPPGTIKKIVAPRVSDCDDIDLYYYPEFLREGSAVKDFNNAPLHILGTRNGTISEAVKQVVGHCGEVKIVKYETAEMLKYLNNSFHAMKVAYINEIASVASNYDVDVDELVECFLSDEKLNISKKYLSPGFSFGGPCLTKDLEGLSYIANDKMVKTPLISSILPSNQAHTMRAYQIIERWQSRKIGFLGVSFKKGTSDVRSSQLVKLIELLTDQPSYMEKREIHIKDCEEALSQMRKIKGLHFVEQNSTLPSSCDLLLLGPHDVDEQDKKLLLNYSGKVLDLGFGLVKYLGKNVEIKKAYEVV